ncbi:jg23803 [Pararge aegeria aegeria]|uniref:Jg23803 protein n=1 Tax=Pararge aegeria aegeria TaxID=348720 RepID=A0A8S4QSA0_9NEOP|nr:jg23803 [Pararge aegeria aegeria]
MCFSITDKGYCKVARKRRIGRKRTSWLRNIREWTGIAIAAQLFSLAREKSWSCSLGLVLAFLQDQDQEQDRVFLARPRPRLTVQDLSKNKT